VFGHRQERAQSNVAKICGVIKLESLEICVVCVMLSLAAVIELVTDRRTDGQTHDDSCVPR